MSSSRRIGRPRRQVQSGGADPSADIVRAATMLFGEHGVTGTTMAQIAAAAGLQQSSLYYYFRSKEDVLAALLREANVIPLELVQRVQAGPGPAAVRLFRFVRGDVIALCALPFDINEVHRYAARDIEQFAMYWRERRTLQSRLTRMVRDGIVDGEFRPVNARLAAITIMSNDEAVQNWYRHDSRPARDVAEIGTFLADVTVGGLLSPESTLERVRSTADELDEDFR